MRAPLSAVLAAAVLAVGSGLLATGPAAAAPPSTVDYVALGDSYAAGVGAGTENGACRRTDGAYPSQWAATGGDSVTLDQEACSGAATAEVLAEQVKAISAETDLITLTVGTNDLDLVGTLRVCADASQAQACATRLAAAEKALTTTFPAALAGTLTAARTAAPKAKIAVVGYPLPFEDVANCALPLPKTLRDAGNTAVAGINRVLTATAAAAGATFVDVAGRYAGHGLCSGTPWLVGLEGLANDTLLHPTRTGQTEGQLAALTEKIGTPEQVLAWITERDTPPSAAPSETPASGAPATTPAAAAGGSGGGLPVTGTNVAWVAAVGLALLIAGAIAYRALRPRKVRVVAE